MQKNRDFFYLPSRKFLFLRDKFAVMRSFFGSAFRFLRFYFSAQTRFGIHSPFVFSIVTDLLEDRREFYAFSEIETIRKQSLSLKNVIEIKKVGAGSRVTDQTQRPVSHIVKNSSVPGFWGRFLFKSVLHFKARAIVELGTSLGFSTMYLAKANSTARVFSIEADAGLLRFSKGNFKNLKLENICLFEGAFEHELPALLTQSGQVDLAFIDGDHRFEPTVAYFKMLLEKAGGNSVFIFDDIHWSDEMERAWQWIQNQSEVTLTIDFYRMGMVFFKKEFKEKQHFKIVPFAWKPWRIW